MEPYSELQLIRKNYCIGCGVCATIENVNIQLNKYGMFSIEIENINKDNVKNILSICPFSNSSENEEILAKTVFSDDNLKDMDIIGKYYNTYVGHVLNENDRLNSSSGGIITWLLLELLRNHQITHAVFVSKSKNENLLFEYVVSSNEEEILEGASSKYYPVELSSVLSEIKKTKGKYAIVALPCFTKSLRRLQKKDDIFNSRIKFIISPICGHLKSTNYAQFLAWQADIKPNELIDINFRKKNLNSASSNYGTEFSSKHLNDKVSMNNRSFKMGTDWGHGMFKYPACDYCDDIVGELGDVSVGDAWLEEFTKDSRGNSATIVRDSVINNMLLDGVKRGQLSLQEVPANRIIESQEGGVRNKRQDLQYRLFLKHKADEWYPKKRVVPTNINVSSKRAKIIKQRMKISLYSHDLFLEALKKNDLKLFHKKMKPIIDLYNIINNGIVWFCIKLLKKIS